MKKRGQVTVFIIVAILLVIIIAIFLTLKLNSTGPDNEFISPDIKPVYTFIEKCIKDYSERSIYFIGQSGGYYSTQLKSTPSGIAYYYSDEKSYIPSRKHIENELASYMNDMISYCTRNFEDFKDISVKSSYVNTSVNIVNSKVIFNVDFPLTLTKGDKTYSLEKFNTVQIPSNLFTIYDLASNITTDHITNGNNICISCIYEWATNSNLYVEMNDYDNSTKIFTIRDDKLRLLGLDYRYYFANKYS